MSFFTDIYFPKLDHFAHSDVFQNIEQVWAPLKNLEDLIRKVLIKEKTGDKVKIIESKPFSKKKKWEAIYK